MIRCWHSSHFRLAAGGGSRRTPQYGQWTADTTTGLALTTAATTGRFSCERRAGGALTGAISGPWVGPGTSSAVASGAISSSADGPGSTSTGATISSTATGTVASSPTGGGAASDRKSTR